MGVSAGGTASGTTVSKRGFQDVFGTAVSTTVASGGQEFVEAGGIAIAATISSGGTLNVLGTTTSVVTVLSGGTETVSSGGLISGTPFSGTHIAGGTVNLLAGGSAAYVGVSSGGIFNVAGTILSAQTVFSGGTETCPRGHCRGVRSLLARPFGHAERACGRLGFVHGHLVRRHR